MGCNLNEKQFLGFLKQKFRIEAYILQLEKNFRGKINTNTSFYKL